MPLTEDGFINVSSELYRANGTSRGGRYEFSIPGDSTLNPGQSAAVVGAMYDHDSDATTATVFRAGPDALTHIYSDGTDGNAKGTLLTIVNAGDGIPDDPDYRYRDTFVTLKSAQATVMK